MSLTLASAVKLLKSRGFIVIPPTLTISTLDGAHLVTNAINGTWRGYDFRNLQLGGADFRGLDLTTARFGSTNLDSADFRGANVSHCHFRYCNLFATDFRECAGLDSATFNYSPRHLARFSPPTKGTVKAKRK